MAGKCSLCPIFDTPWKGPLPADMRGKSVRNSQIVPAIIKVLLVLLLVAVIVSAVVFLGSSGFLQSLTLAQPTIDTQGKSWLAPSLTPSETISPTQTPYIASPSPSPTYIPSSTPTIQLITETKMIPITGGVSLETPFGPNNQYLVHEVLGSDTLEQLAVQYKTAPEVIKKVNFTSQLATLWPGMTLVILPDRSDPTGLVQMRAVYNDQATTVREFVAKYKTDEPFLRENNLIEQDRIPARRWIILSNVPPTSTPTPALLTPSQLGSPSPTPGPALNQPFGPDHRFLIHTVLSGESINQISTQYNTSPEVIIKVNFPSGQTALYLDAVIVILPGQKTTEGIIPLRAVYVYQNIKVMDFITKNKVPEDFFRKNNMVEGEWVYAGRWVVVPVETR